MKGIVYVKFPKTGLGNLLLIWARAKVFAHINELPVVTAPWWGFRLGAWLRREKKKRLYWGYFKEDSWLTRFNAQVKKNKLGVIHEPSVEALGENALNKFFLFDQVITDKDLFGAIRNHRDFIKTEILNLLSSTIKSQLNKYEAPVIAVHIRRGDFKLGNPITPLSFFADGIRAIRSAVNQDWPVTIFTDASLSEVDELLQLPAISVAEDKPDILDILLMSQSKVIILSQSSTFSYWGAFLSDAVILFSDSDWQKEIRSSIDGKEYKVNYRNADCHIRLTEYLKGQLSFE